MPTLGRRTVKSLDREARQITLEDPAGDRVLKLSPRVKIETPAGPARIEDIRPKAVSCGLSPDRTTAEILVVLEQ